MKTTTGNHAEANYYQPGALLHRDTDNVSAGATDPSLTLAAWTVIASTGAGGNNLTLSYTPPVDCIALLMMQVGFYNDTVNKRQDFRIAETGTSTEVSRATAHQYVASNRITVTVIGYMALTAGVAYTFQGQGYVFTGGTVTVDKTSTITHLDILVWRKP